MIFFSSSSIFLVSFECRNQDPGFGFAYFFLKSKKSIFFSSFAIESENNNHCVLKKPSKIAYFVD
jgi:hypothetical protein